MWYRWFSESYCVVQFSMVACGQRCNESTDTIEYDSARSCRGDIKCMVPCRCISDAVACALLLLLLVMMMM